MRALIWLIGIFALAVGVTMLAGVNDGYVLVVLSPWRAQVSLNLFIVVLVVGVVVSIFQAATQINEQTLSFVPKILAAVAVLGIAGPWMMTSLVEYLRRMLLAIPSVVN